MAKERKRRPLPWTDVQLQALNLIFEGRKSQAKIAEDCGIPVRTLEDWIAHPDFQAALKTRRDNLMESLDNQPYIRKERRLIALAQMAESAREQYEEHPLLKEIRPTPDGELVNEHFNRDAHAAFRESLAEIAAELGARKNVTELSGTLDVSSSVTFYLPQPEQAPADDCTNKSTTA